MVLLAATGWPATAVPATPAAPAACPESIEDRYEPGDRVTIVGYTRHCVPDVGDSVAGTRPLRGHLHPDPHPCPADVAHCIPLASSWFGDPSAGIPLGALTVDQGRHPPRGLRMTMTFTLPADLDAGVYFVTVCQDPCPAHLNYGNGRPLFVGVDPPAGRSYVRHWPLDDPAIADLPADAVLLDPGGDEVTAGAVRARTVATTATTATGTGGGRERVETTAAPASADQDHGSRGASALLLVAFGGPALLLVAWRRGAGRKQVRRPPAGRP